MLIWLRTCAGAPKSCPSQVRGAAARGHEQAIPATFTIFNFTVDEIDQAVDELTASCVPIQRYDGFETDDKGIYHADGHAIAWVHRPRRQRPLRGPNGRLIYQLGGRRSPPAIFAISSSGTHLRELDDDLHYVTSCPDAGLSSAGRTPLIRFGSSPVMKASLQDHEVVAVYEIHQTVLVADPSRPSTGEQMTKWLRLADTGNRVSQRVVDQPVDAFERASISSKPVRVVLPPVRCEDQSHLTMACSSR
jgi:hypothetical protein